MNVEKYKQLAKLIRDNDIYKVYDFSELNRLNLSLTELNPQKSTVGHSHAETEEIYVFIDGEGEMENGAETLSVKSGDVVLVKAGDFHRVHNKDGKILSFWAIFEKYEGRGV